MSTVLFHGGIAGARVGDVLTPSPPHVTDGCPVCVARAAGLSLTVGAFRAWAQQFGERARPLLASLADADDDEPIDPPSGQQAIYATSDRAYARWYAARSKGDLYRVVLAMPVKRSTEDHFPTWTAATAHVVEVVERRVRLTRPERRALMRRWKRADRLAAAV